MRTGNRSVPPLRKGGLSGYDEGKHDPLRVPPYRWFLFFRLGLHHQADEGGEYHG
jgi:hypothetical protein